MADIEVIRHGAAKPNPFTICIVANRLLERPYNARKYAVDPILANPAGFANRAQYIVASLFGALAGQREGILNDPAIGPNVRIVSIFDGSPANPATPNADAESLVGEDSLSNLVIARRIQTRDYVIATFGKPADIVYAVTDSPDHTRASAWFSSDDPANAGHSFGIDGATLVHCYNPAIPGTIAIHRTSDALTAPHEFSHALSSYQNGAIIDLYINNTAPAVNCKIAARPFPRNFGTYAGTSYRTDLTRTCIGYPAGWNSFGSERNGLRPAGPDLPATMDNYYLACRGHAPLECEHDGITRAFLRDRLLVKIARP